MSEPTQDKFLIYKTENLRPPGLPGGLKQIGEVYNLVEAKVIVSGNPNRFIYRPTGSEGLLWPVGYGTTDGDGYASFSGTMPISLMKGDSVL
jgi:hypothetical protein